MSDLAKRRGEYTVKTFEEHVRGTEFKKAYWSRAEELVPLLKGSDQEQVIKTAMNSLGRRGGKPFKKAAATGSGPLSLAQADRVALRYGLWTVRKKYDWGHYPRGTEELTRRLDEQITSGIWDLDVKLRRNLEAPLKSGRQDIPRAQHLRALIEARAGETAASLHVAHQARERHTDWEKLAEYFDEICNELDFLLTVAGAPIEE
ncbi:MAG: hypothetical protein ABR592_12260 [Nitriliruptorales bacterium]